MRKIINLMVVLGLVFSSFAQNGIQGLTNYYDPCCSGGNVSILDWAPEDDNGDLITILADLSLASNNASTCDAAMPPGALIDSDGSGTPDAIDPCQLAINTSYCLTVYYNGDFAKVNVNKKDNPVIVGSGITVELCEADIDGDAGTGLTAFYELDNLLDLSATSSRDNPVDAVWTSADGTVNNFDEFEHSYTSNNTSEVLTVNYSTGSTGCDIDQDFNITVFKASDASWTSPGTLDVSSAPITLNADFAVSPADQGDLDAQWAISSGAITSNGSSATFTPSTAGDYDVTYTVGFGSTGNGCRNSETHTIKVNPNCDTTYRFEIDTTACDIYRLVNGTVITQNGTYTDSLTAFDGCDSIITHLVNINTSVTTKDTIIYFVSSSNFEYHIDVIDSIGIDTLTKFNTCDSIITRYEMFTYIQGDYSDTLHITDTNVVTVFDTTYISVEDTLIIRMGVTTSSGLSQSLFNEVIVYPNPASELIVIEFDVEGDYQVILNNSSGQIVSLNNNVSNYLEIDISDFTKGLYFITIRDNDGVLKAEERKIVID